MAKLIFRTAGARSVNETRMGTTRVLRRAEQESNVAESHPLDGKDEWECYDQHITERNKLIEGKRNAEDNFVKTVIQLSSAMALLVPGFIVSHPHPLTKPSALLVGGLILIFCALMGGLAEQFLSSLAYATQIKKTDDYYAKRTSDLSPPAMSKAVVVALFGTFLFFLSGVLILSVAILNGPWR